MKESFSRSVRLVLILILVVVLSSQLQANAAPLFSGGPEVSIVKDINSGVASSAPSTMASINDTLFFTADDGVNGNELWKSDGTSGGTVLVKDINPVGDSFVEEIININGTLFLSADDGSHGYELWKSDGTEAGTVLVKDINPGTENSSSSGFAKLNGTLFFTADDGVNGAELWTSDGTEAGTVMVKDINTSGASYPNQIININNTLYFVATDDTNGDELWRSDGTTGGTVLVKDINPGNLGSNPARLSDIGGTLFFRADNGADGAELWKSDGSEGGTMLVKDINPGIGNSNINHVVNLNDVAFFAADDGTNGRELWKSDGTEAGTVLVKDIHPAGDSFPSDFVNLNGAAFFRADDGTNGRELWKSDGTEGGTVLVKNINPGGDSDLTNLLNLDGTLIFSADDGANGYEFWQSDGTESGTVMIEINPGGSSYPGPFFDVNGKLYFGADDGTNGMELWKYQNLSLIVTKTADTDDGTCDSDCSLREAVAAATSGATINFDDSLAGGTIILSSTITFDTNLTIDASSLSSNVSVSGGGSIRIFGVASGITVEMNHLNIINGYTPNYGAGINNYGTLTVVDSNFSNNNADGDADGAAIFNWGGAILTVIDSTFSNNIATPGGGAIKNYTGGMVTITNSIFSGNSASDLGGALNNWSGATMTVTGSTFTNNNATFASAEGGAIFNQGTLTVTDSTFSGNSAPKGGGIYNTGGTLNLTDVTFSTNNASADGGAIYNTSAGTLIINNSTFSNNVASNGVGGAVFNNLGGSLTVTHSTFASNSAVVGAGAILNAAATATIANSSFASNSTDPIIGSGGAIWNSGASAVLNLYNSTLSGNSAAPGGGGGLIQQVSATFHLKNTIIANSTNGDCVNSGGTFDGDHNLIEDSANACGLTDSVDGNIIGFDPSLGALTGSPAYFPLNSGSLAIDAGNDTICAAAPVNTTSQNGVTRPQLSACDIGSYEYPDSTPPTVDSITLQNANPTDSTEVEFKVTFTESVTGVDVTDFTLTTSGLTGAYISDAFGLDEIYIVSVAGYSGFGTLRLDLTDNDSIMDGVGNPLGGNGAGNGNHTGDEFYTIYNGTVLAAPTLSSPTDGSRADLLRPVFDWEDVPDATKYRIQISKFSNFSTLLVNLNAVPSTFRPGTNLPVNKLLYWRVKAIGSKPGMWSPVWSFTSPNPPSIPTLVSPASNALVRDYTPTLDWANSTLPAATTFSNYFVQVDDNSDFSSPAVNHATIDGNITDSSHSPDLVPNTKYYWRVRAKNSQNDYSAWSAVRTFRTAITPTSLTLPGEGWSTDTRRPTFSWESVADATSYTMQVSLSPTFGTLKLNVTTPEDFYTPTADLAANRLHYWRVRVNGTNGPSRWSDVWSFTTANPPSIPVLVSPANNALNTNYVPLLDWQNSTVATGAPQFVYYEVQVDNDSDFSSPEDGGFTTDYQITDSQFTPSLLAPNTKYYWRVRAFNEGDEVSAWSAIRSLRAAMLQPVLLNPVNDPLNSLPTRRPTFDWEDVAGATGYKIVISKNDNLSNPIKSVTITGGTNSQYSPPTDLPASHLLFWSVQATGPNGPSLWSPAGFFITGTPPSVPALVSPANNALLSGYAPVLDWGNSTLPVGTTFLRYEIQVDEDSDFGTPIFTGTQGVITDSVISTTDLAPNTKYYWRVRAVNDVSGMEHFSAWSAVRTFRTRLLAPALIDPVNGGSPGVLKPQFSWTDVDATSYTIQISLSSSFGTMLVNAMKADTSYIPATKLPAGKVLYWRVRSNGANGPSVWSETFSFATP